MPVSISQAFSNAPSSQGPRQKKFRGGLPSQYAMPAGEGFSFGGSTSVFETAAPPHAACNSAGRSANAITSRWKKGLFLGGREIIGGVISSTIKHFRSGNSGCRHFFYFKAYQASCLHRLLPLCL